MNDSGWLVALALSISYSLLLTSFGDDVPKAS